MSAFPYACNPVHARRIGEQCAAQSQCEQQQHASAGGLKCSAPLVGTPQRDRQQPLISSLGVTNYKISPELRRTRVRISGGGYADENSAWRCTRFQNSRSDHYKSQNKLSGNVAISATRDMLSDALRAFAGGTASRPASASVAALHAAGGK